MLLTVYLVLISFLFSGKIVRYINSFEGFAVDMKELDEELDYYSVVLGKKNQEEIKKNEKLNRDHWNFKVLDDDDEIYKNSEFPSRFKEKIEGVEDLKIEGIFSYDILRNPYYCE